MCNGGLFNFMKVNGIFLKGILEKELLLILRIVNLIDDFYVQVIDINESVSIYEYLIDCDNFKMDMLFGFDLFLYNSSYFDEVELEVINIDLELWVVCNGIFILLY